MKIVDSHKMAEIDAVSQSEYSYPSILLMENAGIKACHKTKELFAKNPEYLDNAVFIAGKGNNGGDALVMARQFFLEGGKNTAVVLLSENLQGDPLTNLTICRKLGMKILAWEHDRKAIQEVIFKADALFDGLTGTGVKGELKGSLKE
ncbi:MAG: NAD(P)H-hydrate epimerase, partial [Spirochaetota bacterium]